MSYIKDYSIELSGRAKTQGHLQPLRDAGKLVSLGRLRAPQDTFFNYQNVKYESVGTWWPRGGEKNELLSEGNRRACASKLSNTAQVDFPAIRR